MVKPNSLLEEIYELEIRAEFFGDEISDEVYVIVRARSLLGLPDSYLVLVRRIRGECARYRPRMRDLPSNDDYRSSVVQTAGCHCRHLGK